METKPLQMWLQMWVLNIGPFQTVLLEYHEVKLYPDEMNMTLLSHTPFILWAACFAKWWISVQQLRKAAELTARYTSYWGLWKNSYGLLIMSIFHTEERDFRVLSRIHLLYWQEMLPTFTISICWIPGSGVTLNAHFNEGQCSQFCMT